MSSTTTEDGSDEGLSANRSRSYDVPDWITGQLPKRYSSPRLLGEGGFALVISVQDELLDRRVAMKVLLRDKCNNELTRYRFQLEARMMAQMQHPGIVAVHDSAQFGSPFPWYTMQQVRGATLEASLERQRAQSRSQSTVALRRFVGILVRVAQAVGFAHAQGLVHRDLKPANIMVGQQGEVLVMDWGVAARLRARTMPEQEGAQPAPIDDDDGSGDETARLTRSGDAIGTFNYMSPEQALGNVHAHCPASDVFSIGCILFEILTGHPPYRGSWAHALRQAQEAAVPAISDEIDVPDSLLEICRRALRRECGARYSNATMLASALTEWLDGVRRRDEADKRLALAAEKQRGIQLLERRIDQLKAQAQQISSTVEPQATETEKEPLWQLEDEIGEYERQHTVEMAHRLGDIHGALSIDGGYDRARDLLSEEYRRAIVRAERDNAAQTALRFITLLTRHDGQRHAEFLRGYGEITLVTDPPGAVVTARRYQRRLRRLVLAGEEEELGTTPLVRARLRRGGYMCTIRHPQCDPTYYPVSIERGEHWSGVPPEESDPWPIRLPRRGELAADERYVPAGWCRLGGDDLAIDSSVSQRVWIGGFVMKRNPVTQQQYVDLIAQVATEGRLSLVSRLVPAQSSGQPLITSVDRTELSTEALHRACVQGVYDTDTFVEGWPIVMISWHAATAYAQAAAQFSGMPWRLPHGLEREKAARGVDSRAYPWGQYGDPAFCWVMESHFASASRQRVEDFRRDISPYGIHNLAGNTRDWCGNPWLRSGPRLDQQRLTIEPFEPTEGSLLTVRGGAWSSPAHYARSASRFALNADGARATTGVRLVRSFDL